MEERRNIALKDCVQRVTKENAIIQTKNSEKNIGNIIGDTIRNIVKDVTNSVRQRVRNTKSMIQKNQSGDSIRSLTSIPTSTRKHSSALVARLINN